VSHVFVFNGDADGLCGLQQLRLSGEREGILVTGVKRDIELVARVTGAPGDTCTVLDVSLDVNRTGVLALLDAGVHVRYFDHHFAGEIPAHPNLDAHIDLDAKVCTSILVDRYLEGRCRAWAAVGAFGDSLREQGRALSAATGVAGADVETLEKLGLAINYNAYGETIADLHVPPADLAAEMLGYPDPLQFANQSATYGRLAEGFRDDMERARRLEPARQSPGALVFVLPDLPWARRASGTLANDLAKAHAGTAIAIVSPKTAGGWLVSVRVPSTSEVSADAFCRKFPTGGGRRTAAGINHLPNDQFDSFATAFEAQFRAG